MQHIGKWLIGMALHTIKSYSTSPPNFRQPLMTLTQLIPLGLYLQSNLGPLTPASSASSGQSVISYLAIMKEFKTQLNEMGEMIANSTHVATML